MEALEPVKETLFIALIHGFYGGEDTFGTLPTTLRQSLSSLDLVIKHFVFKSQGDLGVCVDTFRKWHREQIDAIESMKGLDVPTTKTILISHSMGGIIAVESLFSMIDNNDPLHSSILGIMAFDTPYFGLNPPVVHRTISTRVNNINSVVSTAREWIPQGLFTSKQVATTTSSPAKSTWGWGKTMAAVGAGAAAVGALGYLAKDPVVNHLQFVKVLYKPEELARRMRRLGETDVGFSNFYTVIWDREEREERTFCNLPKEGGEGRWVRQVNGVAKDEVEAHCGMFLKGNNDHYEEMCSEGLRIMRSWIERGRD